MRRLTRHLGTVIAVALTSVVWPLGTPEAGAATVPTASCVDGNYFDGLDTRYAATYCANALTAAGYAPTRFRNTDAQPIVTQQPTDAVFYHAGHAMVYCDSVTRCTAISSAAAGSSPSATTYTGLLGDYLAADFQGPATVCDGDGRCRQVTVVNYPYTSEMQKFNLAVFHSCNTALDGAGGYLSPTTIAYGTALAGTAIGFKDEVAWIANSPGINIAGDAFARRFWSDLQAGRTYATALVNAVNAAGGGTYGHSGYVYRHQADAPTRLRPAGYYVPGAGAAGAFEPTPVTVDAQLSDAVGRALDRRPDRVAVSGWRTTRTASGPVIDVDVIGVGVVQLDSRTREPRQIIYESALDGADGPRIGRQRAAGIAARYAAGRFPGFAGLSPDTVEYLDHGSFAEYRYVWRQRAGAAWLPTSVAVGVNARTGEVAYYWSERVPVPAPARAKVGEAAARSAALGLAAVGDAAAAGDPRLEVSPVSGRLVWSVPVRTGPAEGARIRRDLIVQVDALDGKAAVWATT